MREFECKLPKLKREERGQSAEGTEHCTVRFLFMK